MSTTKDIKAVYRAECRHPAYVLQDEGKPKPTMNSAPEPVISVSLNAIRAYKAEIALPVVRLVHA